MFIEKKRVTRSLYNQRILATCMFDKVLPQQPWLDRFDESQLSDETTYQGDFNKSSSNPSSQDLAFGELVS